MFAKTVGELKGFLENVPNETLIESISTDYGGYDACIINGVHLDQDSEKPKLNS